MLKLLLGHWKAHRKKPSLLPEDGDVHFEEPSTINPIFEDSDSSISSTQKPGDSKPPEETISESQATEEQNQNASGVPIDNELVDVSVPTHSRDSAISDINVPKNEITGVESDKSSLAAEAVSETNNLENSNPSKESETLVEDQNSVSSESAPKTDCSDSILSKDEIKTEEIKNKEKMRIYNQPSTSAIRESKKLIDTTFDKKDKNPISVSKPTDVKGVVTRENEQNSSFLHKTPISSNGETKRISGTPKQEEENISSVKSLESNNLTQKTGKLKTRAIDELIKKFQGQTSETDDVVQASSHKNDTIPSFLHKNIAKSNNAKLQKKDQHTESQKLQSAIKKLDNYVSPSSSTEISAKIHEPEKRYSPNKQTKIEKLVNNNAKSETGGIHSLPTETNVNVSKTTNPKNEELSKTAKLEKKNNTSKESNQEKEALSNIFKFPPPPPLEQLPNKSSLHEKVSKERKPTSILPAPSNLKENADNRIENETGKTRSDSSLDRTRTVSSSKPKSDTEKIGGTDAKVSKNQEDSFKELSQQSSKAPIQTAAPERQAEKDVKKSNESSTHAKTIKEAKHPVSKTETSERDNKVTKITESTSHTSPKEISAKETQASSHKNESGSSFLHQNAVKSSNVQKDVPKSPVQVHNSSISKASSKPYLSNETENGKSHSEDSGITRGDQISSEATQETPPIAPPEEANVLPNSLRKSKKEKKLKSANKKTCKHCKHVHTDSVSLKRSQYDDYYDGLTGVRRVHKNRHSDSWTSDLSFEEKELLRRLRSRRGTVRSNTPSSRSRHSKHRFLDESHFRRHHNFRHSLSDESSFYGASVCSCDACWALYIKDQAYGRASLRGMSPIQEMCTCRNSRPNFLGRRVQFRAETIPETSPSERTATTPAPPAEKTQDDDTDDKSSLKSSKSKDKDSVSAHPDGIKGKNKVSDEVYRLVTPWELEEWDLLMRKHLLKRRRRRARCMGLMALSMVVFIGLVVGILMIYLRRKVI